MGHSLRTPSCSFPARSFFGQVAGWRFTDAHTVRRQLFFTPPPPPPPPPSADPGPEETAAADPAAGDESAQRGGEGEPAEDPAGEVIQDEGTGPDPAAAGQAAAAAAVENAAG